MLACSLTDRILHCSHAAEAGAWAKEGRQAVVGQMAGKPRFSMACASGEGKREVFVFGGVNMLEDLSDVIVLRRGGASIL